MSMLRTLTAALAAVLPAAALAPRAEAQLTPDQLYYGINRPIPMTVKAPPGGGADRKIEIVLLKPAGAEPVASAPALEGRVDLAAMFPLIWKPEVFPRVYYAQLAVDGIKVGPAVVVQPMQTPETARVDSKDRTRIVWSELTRTYSGVRTYVDKRAVFETSLGNLEIALRPDVAPNTAWNFRCLVEGGYYNGVPFHRVVAKRADGAPFVLQAGDPTGTGEGGPGYAIALERSSDPAGAAPLLNDYGVLSMARAGDPNSAGSQFFIGLSAEGTRHLNGGYATFGEVVSGADTLKAIASVELAPEADPDPRKAKHRPKTPPVIVKATLVDAPPYGEGPGRIQSSESLSQVKPEQGSSPR